MSDKLIITQKMKDNASTMVHHFETDGDGKFSYDELILATIKTQNTEGEIEVCVIPDNLFEDWSVMPFGMATSVTKDNPNMKSKMGCHKIWFKKSVFLQINQEEFDALLQHELTHLILKHEKLNNADEKICELLNVEYSFILKQLDKKFLNGTYAYFAEREGVV